MAASSADRMVAKLRSLLMKTIDLVLEVTDADTAWSTPRAHSQAGAELSAEESRRPKPQTGSWPWLGAPITARMALQVAVEEAKGFSVVLDPDATVYAADVLCRAVLESSSLAWWLLEPNISAERRLARSLVYRLHTARETKKAVDHLGLGPDEDRSEYGELPEDVEQEITRLGPTWTWNDSATRVSWGEGKQAWPSYTDRVEELVCRIWPQSKMPYAVLSAVSHAEMLGLARSIVRLPGKVKTLRPASDPTGFWLWHDAYLALGALAFTADRAASFLSLSDQLAALRAWTAELDRALSTLRPAPP